MFGGMDQTMEPSCPGRYRPFIAQMRMLRPGEGKDLAQGHIGHQSWSQDGDLALFKHRGFPLSTTLLVVVTPRQQGDGQYQVTF